MQGMDRLLELQELDSTVDRLVVRRRVLESGDELTSARSLASAAEAAFGELQLSISEVDRDQGKIDHEVDSLTQKATAEEKRLYDGSVVNVRELESLQSEIANLKRRRADREDELLIMMERREELEILANAAEKTSAETRSESERIGTSAESEVVEIAAKLAAAAAAREALTPVFDPELLELYEDVRSQKKGIGAAALIDGVCGGCHEKLSAMELDKLKKAQGVKRCEYYRRILIT